VLTGTRHGLVPVEEEISTVTDTTTVTDVRKTLDDGRFANQVLSFVLFPLTEFKSKQLLFPIGMVVLNVLF